MESLQQAQETFGKSKRKREQQKERFGCKGRGGDKKKERKCRPTAVLFGKEKKKTPVGVLERSRGRVTGGNGMIFL